MARFIMWFRQLSISMTFAIYMIICIVLAFVVSTVLMGIIENKNSELRLKYQVNGEQYYLTTPEGQRLGEGVRIHVEQGEYSAKDQRMLSLLHVASLLVLPIVFTVSIVVAAMLFYRQKLKRPLSILNIATEHIAAQQLDFKIDYPVMDELGRLCYSFETMRASLAQNYAQMWQLIDERKKLNAAFAHDLRTPLTVLKGQLEMMSTACQGQSLSKEKLLLVVQKMTNQVRRLEGYANSMQAMQRLEAVQPERRDVEMSRLVEQMSEVMTLTAAHKVVLFHTEYVATASIDEDLVMQVYENIVSNAIEYSRDEINIEITCNQEVLLLVISDDGAGFSEEALSRAAEPYYREGSRSSNSSHFGLGLSICKMICEKHGGSLTVENGKGGGAQVTASFLLT